MELLAGSILYRALSQEVPLTRGRCRSLGILGVIYGIVESMESRETPWFKVY